MEFWREKSGRCLERSRVEGLKLPKRNRKELFLALQMLVPVLCKAQHLALGSVNILASFHSIPFFSFKLI